MDAASCEIQNGYSDAPHQNLEQGDLELVSRGPGGEFTFAWPAGQNALVPSAEGVEHEVHVVSDGEASLLEFAAFPQDTDSE